MSSRSETERVEREITRQTSGGDPFSAAVRATRMPMLITDPSAADNPIVFVNDAFSKLTGYTREETLGRNCRFLQGPETNKTDVARIRDAIGQRKPIEVELLNYKKDGSTFWNRLLVSPVFDEESHELTYFFASQFDVTLERERLTRLQRDRDDLEAEIRRRTFDLGQSEQRLRFVLDAGRLGSWSLDLPHRRLLTSERFRENWGRDPNEPCSYEEAVAAIPDEDRTRILDAVERSISTRSDYEVEHRVITPSGEVRWVQIRGQPFYRADGTPLTLTGISIDITDRKRADEHRALLARELDHRVKNTLATVQSIVSQSVKAAKSLDEAHAVLSARIQSLSAAHEILLRADWESVDLADVVNVALAPFRNGADWRIKASGPALRLPPRVTLAAALALHELGTNAAKYGALSNEAGHVRLDWELRDGALPLRLWMQWKESGGPPVNPPQRRGFGSRLIERSLATELGGQAKIEFRPSGVRFTLEAPLPELIPSAPDAGQTD